MKKLLHKSMLAIALVVMMYNGYGQVIQDSVDMGPSYANDVYYSFENGTVHSAPRNSWDIAFQTTIWSAAILTNGATGVELYTYPNADTTGWASVDTTGMASWKLLYNSDTIWDDGAFNRNATGHPDYGWGKYNPITHDVVGDSLYVIKCLDGQYRKLWIRKKVSIMNTYYLRYANLDGSDEHNVVLDNNPYLSKNFVYYLFPGEDLIDHEPDTSSWDVVFTKYIDIQPNGEPYPVTGVLNNTKAYANRNHPVSLEFNDWQALPMDSTIQPIGYDWKTFDMGTFTWTVEDSLVFFVQTWGGNIYKLYFTGFGGSATGKSYFNKEVISPSGLTEVLPASGHMDISPNPVTDHVNIRFNEALNGKVNYMLMSLDGRQIMKGDDIVTGNQLNLRVPEGISTGMHVLIIQYGNKAFTTKLIISNN